MAPDTRRLGTTGLEITTVGFGARAIGVAWTFAGSGPVACHGPRAVVVS
jgi:hypothetical protein